MNNENQTPVTPPVPTLEVPPDNQSGSTEPAPTQVSSSKPAQPQTLNYEAFDNMPHTPKAWLLLPFFFVVGFIVLIVVAALQSNSYQSPSNSNNSGSVLGPLFFVGFILFVVCIIVYAWQKSKKEKAAFEQFLLDNGWSLTGQASQEHVATSLLGVGHDQRVEQEFSGQYHGRSLYGLVYRYTTGSGKSQQEHFFANLYFELSQEFPLIVLDNKHNNLFGLFSELPERIQGGKTLQLEGDFNDNFRVTVLPGTEQDVLQFLTPDIMAELMQAPKQTDIELEGNKLFIITPLSGSDFSADFNEPSLKALFAAADIMLKHLGEVAFSWQASSSAESVSEMAATALAPRSKLMLNRRHASIGGIIGSLLYLGWSLVPSSTHKSGSGSLIIIIIFMAIVVGSVFWGRNR